MKFRKAAAVLLAAVLTCSLTVTPVFADDVDKLEEQKEAAEDEVSSLQSQLNSLMSKITELENDLITTGEEIVQTEEDLKTLSTLGKVIKDTALCGLGQTSPNPVLSTLNHFYDEYLEHVRDRRCRAKQCKALLTYMIDPSLCIGCHLCAKNCPADAIIGDVRKPHVINYDKCIRCGMCMARCRFKAISVS